MHFLIRVFSLFLIIGIASCEKKPPPQPPPAPVAAATVIRADAPFSVDAVGNVEAYNSVTLKSQIAGQVLRVYFKDGEYLKEGERLFQIDPRPLRQALAQAEAQLAKDLAAKVNAEAEAARYTELLAKGFVSKEQEQQFITTAKTQTALVEADRAAVNAARVQLGYTDIRAPITGRAGVIAVKVGNAVKDNDTVLVTINQVRPIYVTFSLPEQFLPEIRRQFLAGKLTASANIRGASGPQPVGKVTFVDNTVDVTTGTIKLRATFPNEDERLWPGQFLDVSVTFYIEHGVMLVPSQAVLTGQQGRYVFVIKPDMTAQVRKVDAEREYKGMTVIRRGLAPGERVVTDGQLRLKPGAKVVIRPGV